MASASDPVFAGIVAKEKAALLKKSAATAGDDVPPLFTDGSSLVVCVRKRPLNADEKGRGEYDTVTCPPSEHNGTTLVVHNPKLRYDLVPEAQSHTAFFDRVYGENANNQDVYTSTLRPLMRHLDEQRQVTTFAFGQTGSGKSFTLEGLTNRCLHDIFSTLKRSRNAAAGRELVVCISYFEIYCAKAFDLLADRAPLQLREDGNGSMQVSGLLEVSTRRKDVVAALIEKGKNARVVGCTKMNNASSRSHSVLQIMLREVPLAGAAAQKEDVVPGRLVGKCSLVDLAGSEQASEADFELMKDKVNALETAEINKSLLALKECIRAIGRGQDKQAKAGAGAGGGAAKKGGRASVGAAARSYLPTSAAALKARAVSSGPSGSGAGTSVPHNHIPFRGSLLTKVLRDCFTTPGALTLMINTVSPGSGSVEHTLNTLRYASRLKDISKTAAAASSASSSSSSAAAGEGGGLIVGSGDKTTAPLTDNVAGVRRGVLVNGGDEAEIAGELGLPTTVPASSAPASEPVPVAAAEAKAEPVPQPAPVAAPVPAPASSATAAPAVVEVKRASAAPRSSVGAGNKKPSAPSAPSQSEVPLLPLPAKAPKIVLPISTPPVPDPAFLVPTDQAALLALVDAQINQLVSMRKKMLMELGGAGGSEDGGKVAEKPSSARSTAAEVGTSSAALLATEAPAVEEPKKAEAGVSPMKARSLPPPDGLAAIGAPVVIAGQGKAKAGSRLSAAGSKPKQAPKAAVLPPPVPTLSLPPHDELPALASTRRARQEQLLKQAGTLPDTKAEDSSPMPRTTTTSRSEQRSSEAPSTERSVASAATVTATAATAATAASAGSSRSVQSSISVAAGAVVAPATSSGRASPRKLPDVVAVAPLLPSAAAEDVKAAPVLITSRTAAQMVQPKPVQPAPLSVPEALCELEDLLASVSVAASAALGKPALSRASVPSTKAAKKQAVPVLPLAPKPKELVAEKKSAPAAVLPSAAPTRSQPQKDLFFQPPKVASAGEHSAVPIFETDFRLQTDSTGGNNKPLKAAVVVDIASKKFEAEKPASGQLPPTGPAFHSRIESSTAAPPAAVAAKKISASSPTSRLLKAAKALQHEALAARPPAPPAAKIAVDHPYALPADAKGAKGAAAVSAADVATAHKENGDARSASQPTTGGGGGGGIKISKSSRENIASAIASGALKSPKRGAAAHPALSAVAALRPPSDAAAALSELLMMRR